MRFTLIYESENFCSAYIDTKRVYTIETEDSMTKQELISALKRTHNYGCYEDERRYFCQPYFTVKEIENNRFQMTHYCPAND